MLTGPPVAPGAGSRPRNWARTWKLHGIAIRCHCGAPARTAIALRPDHRHPGSNRTGSPTNPIFPPRTTHCQETENAHGATTGPTPHTRSALVPAEGSGPVTYPGLSGHIAPLPRGRIDPTAGCETASLGEAEGLPGYRPTGGVSVPGGSRN